MYKIRLQIGISIIGILIIGLLLYRQSKGLTVSVSSAPGGTYVEGVIGAPRELNPLMFSRRPADRDLVKLIYAGMMKFDGSGFPTPDLAESWAVTADGLSYTFVIRSGLRWHDGVPLSLDDVIFTIGLMQAEDYPGPVDVGALWKQVTVAKLNSNTLKLTLPEPYAPFLDNTTFPVLPAHMFSGVRSVDIQLHPANFRAIGSGPFKLEEVVVDEDNNLLEILLHENSLYHDNKPLLSAIKFIYYDNENLAVQALEQEVIMGVGGISQRTVQDIMINNVFHVHTSVLPDTKMILFNHQNESLDFFQDKKVRTALMLGLNRKLLIDDYLFGQAIVAKGPILPGNWAFNSDLKSIDYDPSKASSLLYEAGWIADVSEDSLSDSYNDTLKKNDDELSFELICPEDSLSVDLCEATIDNWSDLGIEVSIRIVKSDYVMKQHLENRDFEAIMVDLSLQNNPDPDPYPFWHQTEIESGQNYSGYDNRRISEYLEQARITPAISSRLALYKMFQKRFVDEMPALLIYHPTYSYITNVSVNGVNMGPIVESSDRFNSIFEWYIVVRRVVGGSIN